MLATIQFFAYIFGAYLLSAVLLVPVAIFFAIPLPVDRVIQRGGMILAVLCLRPFLKKLGLANRASLGYNVSRYQLVKSVGIGLWLGIAILLCLVLLLQWLEIRIPAVHGASCERLPALIAEGLFGGILVALIEETFFRGSLFAAIKHQSQNVNLAIFASSILYAALHFLRPQPIQTESLVTLMTVLSSLGGAFPALLQLQNLDSFVALLLAGIFLALIRERTGHLGWNIGIHAGWILVIKISHSYTDVAYNSPWSELVGQYDGVTGWLAAVWLSILILLVALWPHKSACID